MERKRTNKQVDKQIRSNSNLNYIYTKISYLLNKNKNKEDV